LKPASAESQVHRSNALAILLHSLTTQPH